MWAARTQRLCRRKQAAIARLGNVNITYAGIARIGLPAVKRLLDAYLLRLLDVLHTFSRRQARLATPPRLVPAMNLAKKIDARSQAATLQLERAVAGTRTATGLSAAFHVWLAKLHQLAVVGDAVAARLKLPACHSAT